MGKMRQSCGTGWFHSRDVYFASIPTHASHRTIRTALPELPEFLCELLPGCCPVVPYVISQLNSMALKIQFILFEPGDIKFLSRGSTLELTCNVLFIVTNNSGRD
jgi:hypothetical protein